jgi:hypothetical protein
MPTLVLRARQEIMPGFGYILPAAEAGRFAAAVPSARMAEIDANHYTITTHDDSHRCHRCVPGRELTPPGRSRLGDRRAGGPLRCRRLLPDPARLGLRYARARV